MHRIQQKQYFKGNLSAYIRKEGWSEISHLLYLKELGKDQFKTKVRRRKEITRIRAEIHKIENKNSTERNQQTWFVEKIKLGS